jgi:hypothetical protein
VGVFQYGNRVTHKVYVGANAGFNANDIFKQCKESRQISSFQNFLFEDSDAIYMGDLAQSFKLQW